MTKKQKPMTAKMENRWKLSFFLVLACLFAAIAAPGREQPGDIWFFPGGSIPAAPRQNQSWQTPETDIPVEYTDGFAAAFAHGLADPRGCEYREVTVPMGNDAYGGFYRLETHGWLLPQSDDRSQQFAILWNGLVYPVIATGSAASVADDMQQLIAYHTQRNAMIESESASPKQDLPAFPGLLSSEPFHYATVCALLLRLGETELAEKIYHEAIQKRAGSYLRFGNDDVRKTALWALFSRALAAHMYGDDKLALCYAEQYESLLEVEGITFAETARKLLAEQRRRARQQPAPKSEIDALLLDLENVDARQYGQPGGVILGKDERVKALIAVGAAAVEPLLECLENDRRLTRAVSFHRDFIPDRTIITVADAAYVALSGILQQSFFSPGSTSGNMSNCDIANQREVAQQIRAHYNRYKNMSLEDKWYHILQNDDEPVEAQLQAAANICRKSNVEVIPHSTGVFATRTIPGDTPVQLTGEALRSKTNPSVSELLNRHAVAYLPGDQSAFASSGAFRHAQQMALLAAEWDLPGSLPALQLVSDTIYRELPKYESFKADRLELLVPLTIRRVRAKDKTALPQYCETLLANPEHVLGKNHTSAWGGYLRPLYTFPEDAVAIAAAEAIFNTSGNVWSEYFAEFNDASKIQQWLFTEFMRLAPYRKHVRNGLADKTGIMKSQTVMTGDRIACKWELLNGHGSGYYLLPADEVKADPLFPGDRVTQILRVCDVYAKALAALENSGYPAFQSYWEEAERDRAIGEIALRLAQEPE